MKRENSVGDRGLPWGTPARAGRVEDDELLRVMKKDLLDRKLVRIRAMGGGSIWDNLRVRILWLTVSNA